VGGVLRLSSCRRKKKKRNGASRNTEKNLGRPRIFGKRRKKGREDLLGKRKKTLVFATPTLGGEKGSVSSAGSRHAIVGVPTPERGGEGDRHCAVEGEGVRSPVRFSSLHPRLEGKKKKNPNGVEKEKGGKDLEEFKSLRFSMEGEKEKRGGGSIRNELICWGKKRKGEVRQMMMLLLSAASCVSYKKKGEESLPVIMWCVTREKNGLRISLSCAGTSIFTDRPDGKGDLR